MCAESFTTEIRQAGPQDRQPVMSILKRTNFFRPEELDIAQEVFDDSISGKANCDYQSYVATVADKTIGWVCFGPTPCTVGTFDIYWLAVAPENQKQGIGTSLVNYAIEAIKSRHGRLITIDTSGSQRYLSTQRFYETLGFRKEACIKDFYAPDDAKIIYIRRI